MFRLFIIPISLVLSNGSNLTSALRFGYFLEDLDVKFEVILRRDFFGKLKLLFGAVIEKITGS